MNSLIKQAGMVCGLVWLLGSCASGSGNQTAEPDLNNQQTGGQSNNNTDANNESGESSNPDSDTQTMPSLIENNGDGANEQNSEPDTSTNAPLQEQDYPSNPDEIALTWHAAKVKLPDGAGGVIDSSVTALNEGALTGAASLPVVIYLHGCSGFFNGSDFRMNWLTSQGFVSIAPNSFARSFYPESCSLSTRRGWLYKPTIEMRQNDAAHALEQVRQYPWVDQDNVYIYGFSEGGVIAATLNSNKPQQQATARVIESWNCTTIPWSEYTGISAPDSEPLLTLFAQQDPWLQGEAIVDTCAKFLSQNNGSQAILVDYEPLMTEHFLLEANEIQELVLNFLLQQRNPLPQ